LTVTAVLIVAVVLAAGTVLVDPPANWWPPDVDPREWMLDRSKSPVSAVRQYSPREAMRTGVAPLMYLILFCASAVSLFDVTFFALLGDQLGTGLAVIAVGTGLLLGMNGGGRAVAFGISDRIGRHRAIGRVLAILGIGQLCFAGAAKSGSVTMLLLSALLAGAGGGAFYPLFASLAREYFGERSAARTNAVVYSAKAFGGLLGVGGAAVVTPVLGFATVFLIAGGLALGLAIVCARLRQPGRLPILPSSVARPRLTG
jgi:MFS family permease